MRKIFFATNPFSFFNVASPQWLLTSMPCLRDGARDDEQALELLAGWGGIPVWGYNAVKGVFEPAVSSSGHDLFLVNDGCDDPLSGFETDRDDFLVYHERTSNDKIKSRFSSDRVRHSSHIQDPERSDYYLACLILSDDRDDKVERIINAVFPSAEQTNRTVSLFVARLRHQVLPPLPKELAPLSDRYKDFGKMTPDERSAFVDECLNHIIL